MRRTDVAVIGAGPAGLAISHLLAGQGIEHAVLERDRVAARWRAERWDSLRLLTPNWHARLPGAPLAGADPEGFLRGAEVADRLAALAAGFGCPVVEGAEVRRLSAAGPGFRLDTTAGAWAARAVVLATGACDRPAVPACAGALSPRIAQLHSRDYRRPGALPPGGVLVVGASASGLQIARELAAAGRAVTLAAGAHVRVPRRWRGRDIIWLMDRAGILDEPATAVRNLARARARPSLQLAGGRETLDLARLAAAGVRLAGRLVAAEGTRVRLDASLGAEMRAADARLDRLLARIAAAARAGGFADLLGPGEPPAPIARDAPAREIDLAAEGIGTVLWATGYRRRYPWADPGLAGPDGEIVQSGGLTPVPGLVTLGLPFQRLRKSTFLDGIGADAAALLPVLMTHLTARPRAAA